MRPVSFTAVTSCAPRVPVSEVASRRHLAELARGPVFPGAGHGQAERAEHVRALPPSAGADVGIFDGVRGPLFLIPVQWPAITTMMTGDTSLNMGSANNEQGHKGVVAKA